MTLNHRRIVPIVLAIGVLIIYGTLQIYSVIHPAPSMDMTNARVQDIFVMVISFYFGSSHSSEKKD